LTLTLTLSSITVERSLQASVSCDILAASAINPRQLASVLLARTDVTCGPDTRVFGSFEEPSLSSVCFEVTESHLVLCVTARLHQLSVN